MNRWVRLSAAIVAMIMAGNQQYAWTLFVQPIRASTGWKLSEVQLAFTLFIALGTWAMPLSGWFIDRMGPRAFILFSGVLSGACWAGMGTQDRTTLYVLYTLAGLGGVFVYCGGISVALKWFQDKRGLASGLVTAGFGSGATLFNPLFAYLIRTINYRETFFYSGIVMGALIVLAGLFLKEPPPGTVMAAAKPKAQIRRHTEEFSPREMLRCPQFYMLYVMMLMMGIGGLMATAQVAPVARDFKFGATALAISLSLNPAANGGGRIFWGWVSDHLGRERTMMLAFSLQAIFLASVVTLGRMGEVWFVLIMALVFFTWGELYVLFPAVLTDIFGVRNSTTNYSILYTTKGVASIPAGAIAAILFERTGSWNNVFFGAAAMALCSALGAIVVRKMPLPKKHRPAEVSAPVAELHTTPQSD